jgi:thioredoxin 1
LEGFMRVNTIDIPEEVGSPRRSSEDRIRTVTSSTFKELVLHAVSPVVTEFMSYGCAHRRALEPIIQEVTGIIEPDETIVRANIGVEQELASSYRVQGTPTLIMFLDGSEVARIEGSHPSVSTVLTAATQPFEL